MARSTLRQRIGIAIRGIGSTGIAALLSAAALLAQAPQDIFINTQSNSFALATNASWQFGGKVGLNNNFIWSPPSSNAGYCLYAFNRNPSNLHSFTAQAWITETPLLPLLAGNTGVWQSAEIYSGLQSYGHSSITAAAPSQQLQPIFYIFPSAATYVAVSITGINSVAGSPDTGDFYVSTSLTGACMALMTTSPVEMGVAVADGTIRALGAQLVGSGINSTMFGALFNPAYPVNAQDNNTVIPDQGIFMQEKSPRWQIGGISNSGVQASAVKAAGAAGVKHVIDSICWGAVSAAASAATSFEIDILDGATQIFRMPVVAIVAGAAGVQVIAPFCATPQINVYGTAATSMTCQYSTAIAGVQEGIFCTGYDVQP